MSDNLSETLIDLPTFFGGGGRSGVLEQLSHLTAWARSLVMVTGPLGAGKSMLIERVLVRVAEDHHVNVVRPPVGFLSNGHELLRHVAADLGARVPEQIDAPDLLRLVMQQVVADLAADRSTLLVLDDAHELSANVLKTVAELVDEARDSRGLNVLIAGELTLPEQMAKATPTRENWHEIRLRPLPVNEARLFLKACRPAALDELDATAFQALYRKAGGWPGRIIAQVDGESLQRRRGWRRVPLIHLLWLGAMAGALVVVLVLQQRANKPIKPAPAAVTDRAVDTLKLPPLPSPRTVAAGPGAAATTLPTLPPSQRVPVPQPPASLPDVLRQPTPLELATRVAPPVSADDALAVPRIAPLPRARPANSAVGSVDTTTNGGAASAGVRSITAPVAAAPVAAAPVVAAPALAPVVVATRVVQQPPIKPIIEGKAPTSTTPVLALPKPAAVRSAGVPSAPTTTKPVATTASPPSNSSQIGSDNGWARNQPPHSFTVQLLGAAAMNTVRKYIAAHPDAELRVLRTRRGSADWFVVVAGTFQSRAAAQSTAQRFAGTKAAQPWVRTFDGLQQDIPEQ